jgi:hypothetical protein
MTRRRVIPRPAITVSDPKPSQTWTDGQAVALVIPSNNFTDALGLKMDFAAYEVAGPKVASWLHFHAAPDSLYGTVPAAASGTIRLAVIATRTSSALRSRRRDRPPPRPPHMLRTRCPQSVHGVYHIGVADAAGAGQRIGRDPDRMQLALQFAPPEREKFVQLRIVRGDVQGLPDIALQDFRMIGQTINDFGGRQAIIFYDHDVTHGVRTLSRVRIELFRGR